MVLLLFCFNKNYSKQNEDWQAYYSPQIRENQSLPAEYFPKLGMPMSRVHLNDANLFCRALLGVPKSEICIHIVYGICTIFTVKFTHYYEGGQHFVGADIYPPFMATFSQFFLGTESPLSRLGIMTYGAEKKAGKKGFHVLCLGNC